MKNEYVRLDMDKIRRIVSESISLVLSESENDREIWYRGFDSSYGSKRNHLLWVTDDIDYARTYGDAVEELIIDDSRLKLASLYDIDRILGHEIDYYFGPSEREVSELLSAGYNGYSFMANDDMSECMCLFSDYPVLDRKVL